MDYKPDAWKIMRIVNNGETLYKVFATWYGSFTDGDKWKLNSGIEEVEIEDDNFIVYGYSGSVYVLPKQEACYRTTAYTEGILRNMINRAPMPDHVTVDVLSYEQAVEAVSSFLKV